MTTLSSRLFLLLVGAAHSATTSVNWIIPTSPDAISVSTGDTVDFTWVAEHNVYQSASKSDFDNCVLTGGNELADTSKSSYSATFPTAGVYYYICTVRDHCVRGQKIAVTVKEKDPCFPDSASVTLADGTPVPVATLAPGDTIVAATADGRLTTDTVSALSIAKPDETATFVELQTANGTARLTLTPEHHLPVGPACCTTLKKAKDIAVGETVFVARAETAPAGEALFVARTVAKRAMRIAKGLHSPVLTHGAFPVVDGVVTAFDRIEAVTLASYLLPYAEPFVRAAAATAAFVRGSGGEHGSGSGGHLRRMAEAAHAVCAAAIEYDHSTVYM